MKKTELIISPNSAFVPWVKSSSKNKDINSPIIISSPEVSKQVEQETNQMEKLNISDDNIVLPLLKKTKFDS